MIGTVLSALLCTAFATTLAQVGSDPFTAFTSLGVGGLTAAVVWMWQKDTARQRDKALEVVDTLTKGMADLRMAVDKSNEAHLSSSHAMREMTAALVAMPNAEVWFRLTDRLDRADRADLARKREGHGNSDRRSLDDR